MTTTHLSYMLCDRVCGTATRLSLWDDFRGLVVGLGSLAEEDHRSLVEAYQGNQGDPEGILGGILAYQEACRAAFRRAFLGEASRRA